MAVPIGTLYSFEPSFFEHDQGDSSVALVAQPLESPSVSVLTTAALQDLDVEDSFNNEEPSADGATSGTSTTCNTCGIGSASNPGFASVAEQRAHFKTDWHRYNVKRRVAKLEPVAEEAFASLVDQDDVGSLSGSESDDSDAEDEARTRSSGPQYIFHGPDQRRCAVWKCLVSSESSQDSTIESYQSNLKSLVNDGGRWAVIVYKGGHFAAAVYDVVPSKKRAGTRASQEAFQEVIHKTFHRYVIRAKAGGKQSSQDATGKFAKSAGARLRRYNEAALEKEITETLQSWKETLDSCSLVFVQTTGSNMKTLLAGDKPVLDKNDARIRRVPFVTRRPTLSEIKRILRILATVYELPIEEEKPASAVTLDQPVVLEAPAAIEDEDVDDVDVQEEEEDVAKEATISKKAQKKAKQKAKQKAQKQAAEQATAPQAVKQTMDDEIALAAAQAATLSLKPTKKLESKKDAGQASIPPPRLMTKPRANEDVSVRRARLAAAAEARAQALKNATEQQKLW